MDFSRQPFSVLNERLRPQLSTTEQLYSSLNRLEDRQLGSLRKQPPPYRPTVLPAEPEPKVSVIITEPEEPGEDSEQEDLASDEGNSQSDQSDTSCLITELNLKNFGEEDRQSTSSSEEKENPGELTSEGMGDSSKSGEGGSSLQRSYISGTLPDLINSGRPLSRRRTLGHVSDTVR